MFALLLHRLITNDACDAYTAPPHMLELVHTILRAIRFAHGSFAKVFRFGGAIFVKCMSTAR